MHFSLFDYQDAAARGVLANLDDARDVYRGRKRLSSFALSACTGAGKTVIASAVIEALFRGSENFDTEPDHTAVVLWLTDDESLNNQTRNRIIQSSELHSEQLVSIDSPDFPRILEAGHVYFLNVQKLHDGSTNYTRASNSRPWSLWDTIGNTIGDDQRTLYLVLDEAHKGMGTNAKSRATTVLRLINGESDRPPVPIVWGISATPERFRAAMEKVENRTTFPDVVVPPSEVQASGLLKDTVILSSPDETGQFDTTLLRTAVTRIVEQSHRWETYCKDQGIDPVSPLLVVQIEDKPSKDTLDGIVSTLREEWPDLTPKSIRHVLGDHTDIAAAGWTIPHVDPETVQEKDHIRVLLAKNAVNTGWDCPRAEVLISMRGGQDPTFITQLIGRMVRTPLARRIPSDEMLNSVMCLLPRFNEERTTSVVKALTSHAFDGDGTGDGGDGMKVIRDAITVRWNVDPAGGAPDTDPRKDTYVPKEVFDALAALPSETRPRTNAKPLYTVFDFAQFLSECGLQDDAVKKTTDELFTVLDTLLTTPRHVAGIRDRKTDILNADVKTVVVTLGDGSSETANIQMPADRRSIDDAFSTAGRVLGKERTRAYLNHLLESRFDDEEDRLEEVDDVKAEVAAMFSLPEIRNELEDWAKSLTGRMLTQNATGFQTLDDRQDEELRRIKGHTGKPELTAVVLPEETPVSRTGTDNKPLPVASRHLLADEKGNYPYAVSSGWEKQVIDTELARTGPAQVIGWYRNPGRAITSALQIPYQKEGGEWTTAQPDFIFFRRRSDGQVVASVIDPHGTHFDDGIERLRGFAEFLERNPGAFVAFQSVAKNKKGKLVSLNLCDDDVRSAVLDPAVTEKGLFESDYTVEYS